jgi:hypothetical protein
MIEASFLRGHIVWADRLCTIYRIQNLWASKQALLAALKTAL